MLYNEDIGNLISEIIVDNRDRHKIPNGEVNTLLGITAITDLYSELECYLDDKQKQIMINKYYSHHNSNNWFITLDFYNEFEKEIVNMICGDDGYLHIQIIVDDVYGKRFAKQSITEITPMWLMISVIALIPLSLFYTKIELLGLLAVFLLVIPAWGLVCYWLYTWDCCDIQERFEDR